MNELELKNVSVGYTKPIIKHINTHLPKGKLISLLGENGVGKTTLFKSILGLIPTLNGTVEHNGESIQTLNSLKKASIFSVVFSRVKQVPNISVYRLLTLGRIPYHKIRFKLNDSEKKMIQRALELTEIEHLKHKLCTELSDGQLQKVLIARALVQDTPIILMDEPTAHLDLKNRFKIFGLIQYLSKTTRKTFLISTHEIQLALQMSDWIWWLNHQQLVDGFPEQIAYEHSLLENFAHRNVSFDYKKGRFQINQENKRQIHFIGDDSRMSCWIEHSLLRFGFNFSKNSTDKIRVLESEIYFNSIKFDSIKEVIKFLELNNDSISK